MEELLKAYQYLSNLDLDLVRKQASVKKLKKGDFFIKKGQICTEIAFVKKGVLRNYIVSDSGEENTYSITFPNNSLAAYSSYMTGQPSHENIQSITSAELILFPREIINKVIGQNANWQRFVKQLSEKEYLKLEEYVFMVIGSKAEERYLKLIENNPIILQQIPLRYIASYLGISQRHLSRLRRTICIKKK